MRDEEIQSHLLNFSPEADLERIAQRRYESFGKKGEVDISITSTEEDATQKYLTAQAQIERIKSEIWEVPHQEVIEKLAQDGSTSLPYYESVCDRLATISATRSQIQAWVDASGIERDSRMAMCDCLVNGRFDIARNPRASMRRFPVIPGLQGITSYFASLTLSARWMAWCTYLRLMKYIGLTTFFIILLMTIPAATDPILNTNANGSMAILRNLFMITFFPAVLFSMTSVLLFTLSRSIVLFFFQVTRRRFPRVIENLFSSFEQILHTDLGFVRLSTVLIIILLTSFFFGRYVNYFERIGLRDYKILLITIIFGVIFSWFAHEGSSSKK